MIDHEKLLVISATIVSFIFVMSVFSASYLIKSVYTWLKVRK